MATSRVGASRKSGPSCKVRIDARWSSAPPAHASSRTTWRFCSRPDSDMNDCYTWSCALSSDEVDAGTDVTLKVAVVGPSEHELSRTSVSIRNVDHTELAQAELKKADGEGYESDDIDLTAPSVSGEYVYRAVLVTTDKDGSLHEQSSTELHLVVKPHEVRLNVWDVPSAIVAGEHFKFLVGIKCSAGCNLAGREFGIFDREGCQHSAANLGDDIWPGTDALYCAEVDAVAPPLTGDQQWEVRTAAWCSDLPHAAGSLGMSVRIVSPPDCQVTIEAVDREKQTPIKGARVVMHPYRATTDENGIAKLKVTKGPYDVLVSGSKYVPVSTTVEVTADMITRAELDEDPPWVSPDEAI